MGRFHKKLGGEKNLSRSRIGIQNRKKLIAVRVEDTGGGGGFYEDSLAVNLKTENGIIPLGDNWHFRIAKIAGNSGGIGPNDYPGLLFNAMINPLIPYAIGVFYGTRGKPMPDVRINIARPSR